MKRITNSALPALRVSRAYDNAMKLHGNASRREIVRTIVSALAEGTERLFHCCPECNQKVEWYSGKIGHAKCPTHGELAKTALAIVFPPVE